MPPVSGEDEDNVTMDDSICNDVTGTGSGQSSILDLSYSHSSSDAPVIAPGTSIRPPSSLLAPIASASTSIGVANTNADHRSRRLGPGDESQQQTAPRQSGAAPCLLVGALNIQSLKPKTLELTRELHRHGYDVMLLAETWLKPSTPTRLITIPGYSLHRVDRADGRGYGGVAALIKVGITAVALKVCTDPVVDSKLEVIWMTVKLDNGRKLIVGSLYRPPRHTIAALQADFGDLEIQMQYLTINYPSATIVICGDLNCDMIKAPPDAARSRLEELLSVYSLQQIVTSPTFSSGSLLDVCIVPNSDYVIDCYTEFCHFSPHKFNRFSIIVQLARIKPVKVMSRCLKRIHLPYFHDDLLLADWCNVFRATTEAFLSLFFPILNKHAPVKKITIRNPSAPPVSETTKDLMKQRRRALKHKGRDSPEYRQFNRSVRAAIRYDTRKDIVTEPNKRAGSCLRMAQHSLRHTK